VRMQSAVLRNGWNCTFEPSKRDSSGRPQEPCESPAFCHGRMCAHLAGSPTGSREFGESVCCRTTSVALPRCTVAVILTPSATARRWSAPRNAAVCRMRTAQLLPRRSGTNDVQLYPAYPKEIAAL
jgi:hypothetical protein